MLSLYGPLSTEFAIISRLEQAQTNLDVTEISLREVELTSHICQALSSLVCCGDRTFGQVELYYCRGQLLDTLIAIICSGAVESLCLFAGSLDPDSCSAIGRSLENYTALTKLRFNARLSHDNLRALFQGINSPNSKIHEVTLNGCAFEENAVPALASGLSRNLKLERLSLGQCYLEDCDAEAIISALENHPSLRELSLHGNLCSRKSFRAITKLLCGSQTKIESIDLTWQLDGDKEDFDISALALGLKINRSLRKLNLSRNPFITEQGVEDIAVALKDNSTLEQLWLRGCHLSDAALTSLASCLPFNTSLKQLWLQSTQKFGETGIAALVQDGLRNNTELEDISLPLADNYSNLAEVLLEMQHLLDLNRCGRRILQSTSDVPMSLWPLVLDKIWSIDMQRGYSFRDEKGSAARVSETACRHYNAIYYFLREKLLVEW